MISAKEEAQKAIKHFKDVKACFLKLKYKKNKCLLKEELAKLGHDDIKLDYCKCNIK